MFVGAFVNQCQLISTESLDICIDQSLSLNIHIDKKMEDNCLWRQNVEKMNAFCSPEDRRENYFLLSPIKHVDYRGIAWWTSFKN